MESSNQKYIPMSRHLLQVQEWQQIFCPDQNSNTPRIPTYNIIALRLKLLREEICELEVALENNDLVETADALADIQYVLDGTVLACGLQDVMTDLSDEVHRSNMSKLENGQVLRREDGKVLKGSKFTPPDLATIVHRLIGF